MPITAVTDGVARGQVPSSAPGEAQRVPPARARRIGQPQMRRVAPSPRPMLTATQIEKLRTKRSQVASVLSVYLPVPLDPAALRILPAHAGDLVDAAVTASRRAGAVTGLSSADRDAVEGLVEARGRAWLGHSAAIFACQQLDLLQVTRLPCQLPELAVLAARPYIRPLRAARQRCPGYWIAVADGRHSWLLSVSGDRVEAIPGQDTLDLPGGGSHSRHRLEAHRIQQQVIRLAAHHYRHLAAVLEQQAVSGARGPLVIGGHETGVRHLIQMLSPHAKAAFAGTFIADPNTLTLPRARELADPVIHRWATQREQLLAARVLDAAAVGRAATGLTACLAAVNAGAADLLLVPDAGMFPGFVCERCGALTTTGMDCPDWGTAARPVPDLLEEMASRVIDDGGQAVAVSTALSVAARLRYPLPGGEKA
jgi:hypothetical protein